MPNGKEIAQPLATLNKEIFYKQMALSIYAVLKDLRVAQQATEEEKNVAAELLTFLTKDIVDKTPIST